MILRLFGFLMMRVHFNDLVIIFSNCLFPHPTLKHLDTWKIVHWMFNKAEGLMFLDIHFPGVLREFHMLGVESAVTAAVRVPKA